MRTAAIILACSVGALVTADHVAATAYHHAKADRLVPAASAQQNKAGGLITIRAHDNTTVIMRAQAPAQLARDIARQPTPNPAVQSKAPKRLPQACEQSVSPLAANTTFGARCVT